VGKNKLARWTELGTFHNVIQPETKDVSGKDHRIKGNWKKEIFGNENPIVLELGCGKGEYTLGLSAILPGKNYIGVDIKGARMWRGAKTADEKQILNIAFLRTRIEFINSFFAEDEVDEIWITFPDPYPGKRNSNKRLICPWFLNKYRNFLKDRGIVHLKTDNSELYNYTEKLVENNELEIIIATSDLYSESLPGNELVNRNDTPVEASGIPDHISDNILSIRTHYENIFLKDGLKTNYLAFRLEKEKFIHESRQKSE
jgi:tRNA (guanine-N7-)-methyltransferase